MKTMPAKPITANAISYLRYSHKSQGRTERDSYRRQTEATEKYCRDNGLTLIERLEDLGLSGWDKSNLSDTAALGGFLKEVQAGKVPKGTVLICENLDRLTRADIIDALTLFTSIIKAGVDIVTTMDNKRYSLASIRANPTDLMISITYLTRGNNESATKSDRLKESWKNRRSRIKNNEFAKVNCPCWLEHDGKKYSLIKENAEIVKQIFKLYVSGLGVYSLIQELNRRKIKSFTKTGQWTAVFIHALLQNPAVIGTYDLIDPPKKNYFPPAIDETLYFKAIAQRANNLNHKGRTGRLEINIYGGLCKCHRCGGSMVKYSCKNYDGSKFEALTCSAAKIGKCKYEFTNWHRFNESFIAVFTSEYFDDFVKDDKPTKDKSDEIQGKLSEVEKHINRVAAIVARTESAALESQLEGLENEKKELAKELEAELVRVKTQTSRTSAYAKLVKDLSKHLKEQDFRLNLRNFMRRTIKVITCHGDKYKVEFVNTRDFMEVVTSKQGYTVAVNGKKVYEKIDFDA